MEQTLEPRRWPFSLACLTGLAGLVAIGYLDLLTGEEISLSIFYLGPIAFVAWRSLPGMGYLFAFLGGAVWLAADQLVERQNPYSSAFIPYWNAAVRTGFFLAIVYLLGRLRFDLAERARQALTDDLTGIANTRSFFQLAAREIDRQRRYARPLSLAYLDLDNFKAINDTHGHEVGGALLCQVAALLEANIRATDVAARLGGDEFAVLLPETGGAAALVAAEKVRESLGAWMSKKGYPVTISIGVATFTEAPAGVTEMVRLADELMYEAKRGGKDRVAGRQYPAAGAPA